MPVQTNETAHIRFPDGAKVSVKASGDSVYYDVGAISTDITNTLNWDENQVETANAGKLAKQIKNMTLAGAFTLINLDPAGIAKLGGGVLSTETVAGTTETSISDQTILSGWTDKAVNALECIDSVTGTSYKGVSVPTIASVTGGTDGLLTEDDDYVISPSSQSPSGYSITLNTAGTTLTTTSQDIVIVYTDITPVESTKIHCGSSTVVLSAFAMMITHTDSNGKEVSLELPSVDSNSGGFQFNYKAATSDGTEEMPLTYTAKLDTDKVDGQQLFTWTIDA